MNKHILPGDPIIDDRHHAAAAVGIILVSIFVVFAGFTLMNESPDKTQNSANVIDSSVTSPGSSSQNTNTSP